MSGPPHVSRHSCRFVAKDEVPPAGDDVIATSWMRLQNTLIAWSEAAAPAQLQQDAPEEIVVVLPDAGAALSGAGETAAAPARSVCILPRGRTTIALSAPGRVIRIFSPVPEALGLRAINANDYATPRPRVTPIGTPMRYLGTPLIRVYQIDAHKAAAGRRPPTFQTGTMNVMWIEQAGPNDRSRLNPHSHDDFEEGALVITGEYLQHLRTPWESDAGQWREDEHVTCKPGTLTIVPPTVIHTTEALGPGPHVMLNVFAPARGDHIKSGMVLNAGEYAPA
jgi:mannose-6-phosphate isomerase-like protein (cupin superfamily)